MSDRYWTSERVMWTIIGAWFGIVFFTACLFGIMWGIAR